MTCKRIVLPFLLAICGITAQYSVLAQAPNYTIKGKLGNLPAPAKIYIGYTTADMKSVFDSANIVDGNFELKQYTLHPVDALLYVMRDGKYSNRISNNKDITNVYIEPDAVISLTSNENLSERRISGSRAQKDHEAYKEFVRENDQRLNKLRVEIAKGKGVDSGIVLREQFRLESEGKRVRTKDYILLHPGQFLSLNLLDEYSGQFIDSKEIQPIFDSLQAGIRNSAKGKIFAKKIQDARELAVGIQAPPFSQADTSGKMVSLSSFRGKYVLVDFWASWCGPCRAESPVLVRAYNEFKGKNFEILGVSLDNNRANWIKAIHDDGLPWHHVSDLKYWKNEVAERYGIVSVPQNVLIDPSGKIIARNLKGGALREKLAELL